MCSVERFTRYGRPLTRYGVSLVFLVFGVWQLVDPTSWYGYLPSYTAQYISNEALLLLNGTFDTIIGALLLVGLFTRWTALLGALHLVSVTTTLGWNDLAVRDAGLGIVLLGIFLTGTDDLCIDKKIVDIKKTRLGKILYLFD